MGIKNYFIFIKFINLKNNFFIIRILFLFLLNVNFITIFSQGNKIIDINRLSNEWPTASIDKQEALLTEYLNYALQPSAPNRHTALERLRQLQSVVKKFGFNTQNSSLKQTLETIVNQEVILVDAAIGMNIPNWCGTISTSYLTGDNIAFLCKHRTFKVNGYSSFFYNFDPDNVKYGDTVFVVTNYLDLFFDVYHKQIKESYVLVTDNSDSPVPAKFSNFLEDEKILAWFCINPDETKHEKLNYIPLGIKNHGYGGEEPNFMDKMLGYKGLSKNYLLYINFNLNHQDRHDAIHFFKDKAWATKTSRKSPHEFFKDIAQSKFVLSPRGCGLDCWRTWEILLLGSIPIVKHSPLDKLFEEFPVLIVNNWDEITPEFLEIKYKEISEKTFDYNKLFAEYWGRRINSLFKNN